MTKLGLSSLTDPGTGKVIGSVASAAAAVYPPGYEFGYKEITASVNVTSTNSAAPTTIITGDSFTFDGTACWFEFFTPRLDRGSTYTRIQLFLDTTDKGIIAETAGGTSGGVYKRKVTPAAGAAVPKIMGYVDAGTGIVTAGASGVNTNVPAFLRITKA